MKTEIVQSSSLASTLIECGASPSSAKIQASISSETDILVAQTGSSFTVLSQSFTLETSRASNTLSVIQTSSTSMEVNSFVSTEIQQNALGLSANSHLRDMVDIDFDSMEHEFVLVYDQNVDKFVFREASFGGNELSYVIEEFTITSMDFINKYIILSQTPLYPALVELKIFYGTDQRAGVDFLVTGNILSWNSLGLDILIEEGSVFIVRYMAQ